MTTAKADPPTPDPAPPAPDDADPWDRMAATIRTEVGKVLDDRLREEPEPEPDPAPDNPPKSHGEGLFARVFFGAEKK